MDTMIKTLEQYDSQVNRCKDIFSKKMRDYGTSWRILRPSSITDQIYIKAKRIKTLEETDSKVGEGIFEEYQAIYNYCVMGLIQLEMGTAEDPQMDENLVESKYAQQSDDIRSLMMKKNHDYGEAWREMRTSSLTDMILQKLMRTKQIESNQGKTIASEGIDANYSDMANYAVFAMIQMTEQ